MKKQNNGFTMVEMLAVVAVIAIIIALVVPNGIFARTTGEEATARAKAASIELAMSTLASKQGVAARNEWATAPTDEARLQLLVGGSALPSVAEIQRALDGYQLTLPISLGGAVVVRRASSGEQIYP